MSNKNVNKTKVLFLITKGNFGGAQRYVYDLAVNLPKDKFEAVVAMGTPGLLMERLTEANIKTVEIKRLTREIKFFDEFKICNDLVKLIKSEKPDVVHLNSSKIGGVGAVASLIARLTSKNYNLKTIFTSHGWGFYESHRSTLSHLFFYISHYITVLLCHKTIAVSEKTKRDMAWLPFMKNRIQVIHNGLENFECLPREEARRILDPHSTSSGETDKTVLLSISELHKNKGIDVALQGLALLPTEIKEQIIYCVAGDGEEEENLKLLAISLKLESNVKFLGFVDNAKKLLSGADIFLFPSRTENLPFAILEAGLASLPVISTSVGGIPEIIQDMESGILVHKEKPKEITHALEYLLEHPEQKEKFGKKIHTIVSKNFSLKKMLSLTIKIYN